MNTTSPRNMIYGMIVLVTILAIFSGIAHASAPRLVEDRSCAIVTVASGDTAWNIAGSNNVTLDVIAKLNPQISNLSKIYPGDEIAIGCGKDRPQVVLAPAVVELVVNEPAEWKEWRNTTESCKGNHTCWTWNAIIIALHDAGFRGNDLITMAAIAPGESGRQVDAIGDNTPKYLVNGWGPSVGVFQIRTLEAQQGKGTTRDIKKLATLKGAAESAFDLYESSKARRANGEKITPAGKTEKRLREAFDDWTCYQVGNHVGYIESVRQIAEQIGALS